MFELASEMKAIPVDGLGEMGGGFELSHKLLVCRPSGDFYLLSRISQV
jgi:hypothetical protein